MPSTGTKVRYMYASELVVATETLPSYFTEFNDNANTTGVECDSITDTNIISSDPYFIHGQCYTSGDSGSFFGKV